jgi:hypothetical protein
MTGGGPVVDDNYGRVTHGFELHCDANRTPNNLQVNWGRGNRFHLTDLTSVSCTDDPAISPNPPPSTSDTIVGTGTGRYNNVDGATVEFTFTDAGEPGSGDKFRIKIMVGATTVLDVPLSLLTGGNHQFQ